MFSSTPRSSKWSLPPPNPVCTSDLPLMWSWLVVNQWIYFGSNPKNLHYYKPNDTVLLLLVDEMWYNVYNSWDSLYTRGYNKSRTLRKITPNCGTQFEDFIRDSILVQILAAMTAARDIYTKLICDLYSTASSTNPGDGIARWTDQRLAIMRKRLNVLRRRFQRTRNNDELRD